MMISQASHHDDISQLGQKVYRERIEPMLSTNDKGRFVVIDVDSGDYEIADRDIDATMTLMKRREPGRFYGLRVGHKAAYRLGTRSLRGMS
jgi:hypothetical protein